MIPDDCIQSVVDPWWDKDQGTTLCRGRLLWANLPHVMPEQATLKVEGREEATSHDRAFYSIAKPLRYQDVKEAAKKPVAGLPEYENEVYLVQRAKVRPAIVVFTEPPSLDKALRRGTPRRWTNSTVVIAPAYSVPDDMTPELVKRFRRCEYPNYLYLHLPDASKSSVVRLDQLQPIGAEHPNYKRTNYRLSAEALDRLTDWILWLMKGVLDSDCELFACRELLMGLEG